MRYKYALYLFKSLIYPFFMVTFILSGIIWVTQAVKIIHLIMKKGVDFTDFLYISIMMMPHLLMVILPVAVVIAVTYVTSRFIQDKELIILQTSGLTNIQIAYPILLFSIVVTIIGYFISFYLLPVSYHKFKNLQNYFKEQYSAVLIQQDVFTNQAKDITIYVRKKDDNVMEGIFIYDVRNKNKAIITIAQSGQLLRQEVPRIQLFNGTYQENDLYNNKISMLHFDEYTINLAQLKQKNLRLNKMPDELFLHELFYMQYKNKQSGNRFIVNAHHRITWPLYCVSLCVMVLAILITSDYNRRAAVGHNIKIIAFSTAILITALMSKNFTLHNNYFAILMYLNVLIPMIIGLRVLLL